MSNLDRDLAGLEEDGAEDAYYAQLPSAGAKAKKAAATDDDEDEESDEPSVEDLIHEQESGHTGEDKPKVKKAIPDEIEDDRDVVVDDLAFMEEAAAEIEAEREELLSEEEEEM